MAQKAVKIEGKQKAQPNTEVDKTMQIKGKKRARPKTEVDKTMQIEGRKKAQPKTEVDEVMKIEGRKKARPKPEVDTATTIEGTKKAQLKFGPMILEEDGDDVVEAVGKKKRPRKEHAGKPVDEPEIFPPLSGCLPTSKCRSQMEFPVKIPEEYYDAGLPFSLEGAPLEVPFSLEGAPLEVKKEEIDEPPAPDPLPPAAYSDAKAACLHGVKELIRDGRSDLHSLSPAMMSGLIHFFDFTKAEEQRKPGKKVAPAPKDEATESLLALRHDEGVLKKRLKGWSYFGKGKHHMVVNLMDQRTEARSKKDRAKSHMAPAAES